MTRTTSLVPFGGLLISLFSTVWIGAGVSSADRSTSPLDLPVVGRSSSEADAPAPEAIDFYGSTWEGDAHFFCVERSEYLGDEVAFDTLKSELKSAISQLSRHAEFGIVAYFCGIISFESAPVKATPANRTAAHIFIDSLEPGGAAFPGPGGVATLGLSHQSRAAHKVMYLVGYGHQCMPGAALADITFHNHEEIPIHTLVVGTESDLGFFELLAAQNGGCCQSFVD